MGVYTRIDDGTLQDERARLEAQALALWPVERQILARRLLDRPEGLMIDLGCGTGATIARAAAAWTGWRFLGLDLEARLMPPDGPRARFEVTTPAGPWPIRDGEADAVYARFVMQHAPERDALLALARRALRPGGRVLLVDVDDRASVFEPTLPEIDRIYRTSTAVQAARGGDRTVGARLPGLLHRAGFTQIDYEVLAVSGALIGVRSLLDLALGLKLRQMGEPASLIERLTAEAEATPGFVALVNIFVASGVCPGDR